MTGYRKILRTVLNDTLFPIALTWLLLPVSVNANDGPGEPDPDAWIDHLEQVENGIKITLAIEISSMDIGYRLERIPERRYLFSDRLFNEYEADGHGPFCNSPVEYDPDLCEESARNCHDCDKDGIPDCVGFCDYVYYFRIMDADVPMEKLTYRLYETTTGGFLVDEQSITAGEYDAGSGNESVDETGVDEDSEGSEVNESDAGAGYDDSTTNNSAGCGIAGPGKPGMSGLLLFLVMLLAGGVPLLAGRQ